MTTKLEAVKAAATLKTFMGINQLRYVLVVGCRGEEKQYFFDKLVELASVVSTMPKVYEQDGKGDQAIAYLHYFRGGMDWYITERDTTDEQHQAFGVANLGDGPEAGYISIAEIIGANVELDFHFKPRSLAEIPAALRRTA